MERYYVSLTPNSDGYYSVIDRTRKNEFGERYVLACYLSKQEAFDFLADIRNCEDVLYAAAHLGYYDQSDANEDAEYGAERALYVEETMKVLHPIGHKPDFVTADWRYSDAIHSFAFDADFVTYRRYVLIDAARIEAE